MSNKLRCVGPGFYNTILGSQENLMSTNVRKNSVQVNTFLDRRVNTEVFLKSLEKKR